MPAPHDGWATTGPITYEELSPYYDKVESYIGVFGSKENIPNSPDGVFMPPPKPRCTETLVKKACDRLKDYCSSLRALPFSHSPWNDREAVTTAHNAAGAAGPLPTSVPAR